MAPELTHAFNPTYAFSPGETLAEVLESRQMSQVELAERTGLTPKTVNEIVKGKAPVSPETALHLERVLGLPASFWSNLERRYEEAQARDAEAERLSASTEWCRRFPLRRMKRWGWIDLPKDRVAQVRSLLGFFGTATPDTWQAHWQTVQVSFRASTAHSVDQYALACWLRRGEIEAATIDTEPYQQARFQAALDLARGLTTLEGVEFVDKLTAECAAAGVAVVLVPELPRVRTYGATRWLSPLKALMQLSLRRKSDDQLWFTFFHEAAHILLHPKRAVFLERDDSVGKLEEEANSFARDRLLPPAAYREFVEQGDFGSASVLAFADRLGVAPGIVVGRLQYERLLPYNQLNRLKKRYQFVLPMDR